MKYDPNVDPEYPQSRKYAHLYHMTEVFIGERNRVATWFLLTLGLSFLTVGAILLAWSIDRERLTRRMKNLEHGDDGESSA